MNRGNVECEGKAASVAAGIATRGSSQMKGSQFLLFVASVLFLAGCATQGEGPQNPSLMQGASAVPKESVAAERCPELYQRQEARQGAFHRAIVCP